MRYTIEERSKAHPSLGKVTFFVIVQHFTAEDGSDRTHISSDRTFPTREAAQDWLDSGAT